MEEIYGAVAAKPVETNIDEASSYIRTGDINKPEVYSKICMNLGRTIDLAIGMNAVPSSVHLPQLLLIVKEVCRRKTEFLRPSLISLMLPIKAACQVGWFHDKDKDHLLMMVKEASYGLSNVDNMNIEPSYANSYISNIISRFYPRMKVERVLTSFDVKAGNGKFVVDFHISLGTLPPKCQNLWLLVARMDNMDTAACIASPANVDFLINRRGVPKRTKNDMGKGPQLPSNVTKMMKYGLNLLEVCGDFDGQYMIAVAFMNLSSNPDPPQLQDYIPPASVEVDSDCEVIEISSRISLNCPISQRRIKTPVKGHFCKHPQCFDYNFFMEVNSARPIWKCPVCNKPVCNLDIRIDQDFLKILNEAANNVSHVIISYDGSWMVDMTESFQRPETNRDTKSQNNQVPSISIKTENTLPDSSPALCNSGCLANSSTAECPSTSRQSPVRTSAVPDSSPALCNLGCLANSSTAECPSTSRQSPVRTSAASPQDVRESRMQSQGLCDVVHTSPSVQQTSHQPNPVNTTQPYHSFANPDHSSALSQLQQGQTHQATQADLCTGNSTNSLTAEHRSTLRQSPVTISAVTPQDFRDSSMQSQGLCDVVHMTPSVQQTRNQLNPVNLNTTQPSCSFTNPNHQSAQSQPPQVQTHQATQADLGKGTAKKAQRKTLFTPVKLTPCATSSLHSTVLDVEQLRKKVKRQYTARGQSHPPQAPASDIRPSSSVRPPEQSGDAMPTSKMRGSLRGKTLEAARLELLSSRQPIRANEPWSIPRPPLSMALPTQPPTNSENP